MFPFADSTRPEAIPETVFDHVAAYANGDFEWSPQQLARFPRHILIGVKAGQPAQAEVARCLDMERSDAGARDFPPFCETRAAFGHADALGYTSILGSDPNEGLAAVVTAMTTTTAPWHLWVAWWWGRDFPPSAAEVLAEIHALTGITLPPSRLAACQWHNGPDYDSSVWYIRDTFTAEATSAGVPAETVAPIGG